MLTYVTSSGHLELLYASIWHNDTDGIFVKSIFRRVCTASRWSQMSLLRSKPLLTSILLCTSSEGSGESLLSPIQYEYKFHELDNIGLSFIRGFYYNY